MSLPFLLEIGSEEIPDWMIEGALAQLHDAFTGLLKDNGLAGEVTRVDATPRRLALWAEGLPERQADKEELVTGPPKSSGPGAAAGFAKKQGVTPDSLETVTTPKGEYFAVKKKTAGRATIDILASALGDLVLKIRWPKAMYWTGKSGARFIRPIRWLVALMGDEVVPFEIANVRSGNVTSGHRSLGASRIEVTFESYERKLRENFVIVSAAERRKRIESALERVKPDPALLETLVYITEFPTPIGGSFDPQYLSLPAEVLVTVMRHHQKYFSVAAADGGLAPSFIAVMNTSDDPEGLVRKGNERVLRARFNDARFFWEFDQQKKLADRVNDLAHVTFQAQLGSYLEKTERMVKLVRELGGDENAVRAATLSKCDLTTEMVKEFTELQGVVGGLYARAQGETEEVAKAIYDHYKPVSMEDSIPSTPAGRVVALADKLDTLRGCFRIGLIPSGSRDPFALRRAAQGVIKILVEGRLPLSIDSLSAGDAGLKEFLLDRVRYYFRDVRGFKYDEVNAIIASGWDDLVDVEARLEAIRAVRPTEDFEPLAASFKRIKNILKQAQFVPSGGVNPSLLIAPEEVSLENERLAVRRLVTSHHLRGDYLSVMKAIASLRPAVDRFFDKVLVNDTDLVIRENRLTMLSELFNDFTAIADFSEIVTSQ